MSYRNLTPWSKNSSASSSSSKSTTSNPITLSKFDGGATSNAGNLRTKIDSNSVASRLKSVKLSSNTSYNYQRNSSKDVTNPGNYNQRSELPRLKVLGEKKDPLHPPVSYRLSRNSNTTAPRSRDPSPADASSSCSSSRLAPPTPSNFRRSVSRERTLSLSSTSSKYGKSKEDLTGNSSSNKYISSRFLPKNTIERSNYTGYSRGSVTLAKSNEISRKNRELLNVINVNDGRRSRSISQSYEENIEADEKLVEVVTRATSPALPRSIKYKNDQSGVVKSKISVAKRKNCGNLDDKSVQTEAVTVENGMKSTSWNSILELKFNPGKKMVKNGSNSNSSSSSNSETVNSSKKTHSSCIPEKSTSRKSLPPPIPIRDATFNSKPTFLNISNNAQLNKDFRKSVLNMSDNFNFSKKKNNGRRSNSQSSADSESENLKDSEATDVSENLASCRSFHPSQNVSKLPQKSSSNLSLKCRRSPSSDLSLSSGTEEVDPTHTQTQSKSTSFLCKVLPSTTNFFKKKKENEQLSENETTKWMLDSSNSSEKTPAPASTSVAKIKHVQSGEIPWWLDENAEVPEGVQTYPDTNNSNVSDEYGRKFCKLRRNDSGKVGWWLDSSSESKNSNFNNSSNNASKEFQEFVVEKDENGRILYKIRRNDSSSKLEWWKEEAEENSPLNCEHFEGYELRHIDSGERNQWSFEPEPPLGDRASPEGVEMPKNGRLSPYDNVLQVEAPGVSRQSKIRPSTLFISKHTDIDDLLGGSGKIWSPLMEKIFSFQHDQDEHSEGKQQHGVDARCVAVGAGIGGSSRLDDAALQLYKDGDYGSYLDLDASISEQQEEFEGFQLNKKNSIVLRTQLSVRVHTIIEKLLTSEGRELRRALFSLKQIFQEDKDLVHEFVQNDGLSCLIKVGSEADQNYQNYILRALGQVMLYVDGMNGVMEHNQTIQWLYSLISSKFRLVVKTALKLLLVFVEYTDSNCMLLVKAVQTVDCTQGLLPWFNVMKLLRDFDSADTELLIYATTLINKVLNGVPDQDTYYDQTDALEEQGIEKIIQRYMTKPGTDLDLLQQFQIYEAVLQYEDGFETIGGTTSSGPFRLLDENVKKTLRCRKSNVSVGASTIERRKSRRHSTGTLKNNRISNAKCGVSQTNTTTAPPAYVAPTGNSDGDGDADTISSSSSQSSETGNSKLNGAYKDKNQAREVGVTPALRQRRERAERQRTFLKQQQETISMHLVKNSINGDDSNLNNNNNNNEINNGYTSSLQQRINGGNILTRNTSRKDLTTLMNAVNKLQDSDQPWILSMMYNNNKLKDESDEETKNEDLMQLKKDNSNMVKDITQKLASQNILHSPTSENGSEKVNFCDMTGLISKAMEGLARSKSKVDVVKSQSAEKQNLEVLKKSENELKWEELVSNLNRSLNLCDMDFTDLNSEDEVDILRQSIVNNGVPPPPPPPMLSLNLRENCNAAPPPPPLTNRGIIGIPPPNPPLFNARTKNDVKPNTNTLIKKTKKTVKLFWKEVRDDAGVSKLEIGHIWDELSPVSVDTQKLEHLFESRAKDLLSKKQQEMNKNKEIIVLDPKRSNAINIGMTKLPPLRSIKTAILKMDATIMNREGIEKLLTMLPTKDERTKIQEAQAANPDLPLGSAEQFLLTLASISELPARLKLWAFKLDFENIEKEIAEPLMDLKQGVQVLRFNKTFRGILSTLLSIGNFLNGAEVKGFQIEYLSKVPEVKDTVHKHSLLHHLCHIVMEKFPEATDLYSEIGAITRASKVDFDELASNIQKLEEDCKASWDHLKLITKHDGSTTIKGKMSDFLSDCAERVIILGIIHRRIMNRFHKFLLWLGIPLSQISDTKPNEFCRIISEFALEYRTTRERVLQQLEKKANHRERNKTRGKMITDVGKFKTKEDRADAELRQLLGSDFSDVESFQGTLPLRRTRKDTNRSFLGGTNGNLTDGDDEILESLVKTATKGSSSRIGPRERKRTRHADRKSLKRSRTRDPFGAQDSP